MTYPQIGARIPDEWYSQIEEISRQTGKSKTKIVQEAIAHYLKQPPPKTTASELAALRAEVEALKKRFQSLEPPKGS